MCSVRGDHTLVTVDVPKRGHPGTEDCATQETFNNLRVCFLRYTQCRLDRIQHHFCHFNSQSGEKPLNVWNFIFLLLQKSTKRLIFIALFRFYSLILVCLVVYYHIFGPPVE